MSMAEQEEVLAATCLPPTGLIHMRKTESNKEQVPSPARTSIGDRRDTEAQRYNVHDTTPPRHSRHSRGSQSKSVDQASETHTENRELGQPTSHPNNSQSQFEEDLPVEKHAEALRNLRWMWFTIYHRLSLLVLLPNIIAMTALAAEHNLFKIPMLNLATAVAANVATAVLMRQELVINCLFMVIGRCPRTAPLRFRRILAKIYHLGGVHSGAGIAATIWFTLFSAILLWGWRANSIPGVPNHVFPAIVALTIFIDLLLIMIICFAHPALRRRYHNSFEAVHRFAGWLAVLLFWAHLVLMTDILERSTQPRRPLGAALLRNPSIYLLILVTVCLVLPWLRLRRVSVQVEPLSNHAARWHFRFTNVDLCVATRVTDAPLREWHAFATIPHPDGTGFSCIVSNAGDWTKRMIQHPPRRIWVRGLPTHGLLHIAPIFDRIVLVATGSGIGPILSLLAARDFACRVLWSARSPLTTYQDHIVHEVFTADPAALVYDSTALPPKQRPDLLKLAYRLYRESKAEAVFVVSNQTVSERLVFGLESRGVPAFAPIFDS